MSKRQLLILLGVWNIVFLFLGFPAGWNKVLAIVSGTLIVIIAYGVYNDRSKKKITSEHHPYTDHRSETPSGQIMNDINSPRI